MGPVPLRWPILPICSSPLAWVLQAPEEVPAHEEEDATLLDAGLESPRDESPRQGSETHTV